jgi:hypothetical protein
MDRAISKDNPKRNQPKRESKYKPFGIEVPEMDAFPFELQNDEAILLYHQNNTAYYYKLKGLIQKETIFFALNNPKN